MDIKILIIVLLLVFVIGYLLVKSATKIMKFSFVFVLVLVLIIYLSSSIAFEKEAIDFTKISGIAKATKIYMLWVFSFVHDTASLTGDVINNNSLNETNETQT